MEKKIKHLELIQGVITRMTNNSFMLKGWAVTLIAGIFALAVKEIGNLYLWVAYIPIIAFWFLDSYYLLQERLYRSLYKKVCQTGEDNVDFSLSATMAEFGNKKNCFFNCLVSAIEAGFYAPLALVCTGIIIITHIM